MKLTHEQIRSAALGAVHMTEEKGRLQLYRFTPEQLELYRRTDDIYYQRALCSSGIRLRFRTDSVGLALRVNTVKYSSRSFFAFDIYVNGSYFDSLNNFYDRPLPQFYAGEEYPLGLFEKRFTLPQGEKDMCVYLPYTVLAEIEELSLDDGARFLPVKPEKKLLAFGDSITHGYDALHPSGCYISLLADLMGAELYNKGIGGERFFPPLAQTKDPFTPDCITVAYGTNDWSGKSRADSNRCCREFLAALRENYPGAGIFVISPVWRADMDEMKPYGAFDDVARDLRRISSEVENVTFVSGLDLVPHSPDYFGDGRLHPNDAGFSNYALKLYAKIRHLL